ncbi:MAG: type I-C CRISPR-associated endonuclease Cas1c [Sumerlaeia bacterium]
MRKLLNTLYLQTEGLYLGRDGDTVDVRQDGKTLRRFPIHTLDAVVCFGRVGASPALMGLCGEAGVGLTFLSEHGRFRARVVGRTQGNVLLRREQYRRADCPRASADLTRAFVSAKIANARTVLLRGARRDGSGAESGIGDALSGAALRLAYILRALPAAPDVDTLRGREGEAAAVYFGVYGALLCPADDALRFTTRNRRPPRDAANALLSFLYTLLRTECAAACEAVGLDPCVGFLHRDRPGRESLALDLMEELRPVLADRLAATLINRGQVKARGFTTEDGGGVTMDDKTRKTVLTAWQERKREELTHPFLSEKCPLGLLPHLQAMLLARHLRGDLDGYPPFVWK